MARFDTLIELAVDTVYPRRCAGCGRRGSWLCPACDAELSRFAPPWCARCGVPQSYTRCQCPSMPENLTAVRSVAPFDGWMRGAIHHLKYHGEWARAEELGAALANVAGDLSRCEVAAPVPLHPNRLKQRGFNQSQLLAEVVARKHDLPLAPLLVRTRRTGAQAHLRAEDRLANVSGAFALHPRSSVAGRAVLLIDDVITTASTLAACADALMSAGAKEVSAATLAREL